MKTAISLPDGEFERFERVAARHGLNRSEFYRRAASLLAEQLDGEKSRLTTAADVVLTQVGQPVDPLFLTESRRVLASQEW